jgi:hypothetical protein
MAMRNADLAARELANSLEALVVRMAEENRS